MENHKKVQQPFLDKNNEPIQMGVNDNLEKLKALFPSVVKDGFVDFTALKEELGEIEEVGDEKYNFTWWGKQGAKIEAKTPPVGKTLNYKENGNDNFKGETENLYIEGDNLEVLKLLKENYYGKIKMIYIDPPYNTGKDFVYRDNFHMSQEESDKAEGLINEDGEKLEARFKENSKGNRYHSNWLNMMYARLKVAHSLLKNDGVIFVSIDDNEIHNLKKICDEIFGEDNFVGEIILQTATDNNPRQISTEHEYIICYARDLQVQDYWSAKSEKAELIQEKYSELLDKYSNDTFKIQEELRKWINKNKEYLNKVTHYDNVDEKGVFHDGDIANTKFGGYMYDVIHPLTGKVCKIPDKGYRFPKTTMDNMIANDEIMFGADETTLIKPKKRLENAKDMLRTVLYEDGRTSTKKFESMLGRGVFSNPKSTSIIGKLMKFTTKFDNNDIILDFFSGSASTAQAVMELNVLDGGNRKFILVQIPELCDEKTEAYKSGYKNICEIGKKRICIAGDNITKELIEKNRVNQLSIKEITKSNVLLNENTEYTDKENDIEKYQRNPELLDIGFKVFEVGKTNIKWNDINSIEDVKTLEELQLQGKDSFDFTPHFTDVNVVYEIALQHRGVPLSSSLEKLTNIGERTYLYANSYLVCLEEDVTEDIIKKISQISPQPISYYFRDSAFGENIALKDDTIRTFKDLISINYGNNKGSYTLEFI